MPMTGFSVTELYVLTGLAEGYTTVEIGEKLHMGHSAVSKLIHAAEKRTGIRLAEMQGRRLRLTEAGLDLAQRMRFVVAQLDELDRRADELRTGTSGTLRVVATSAAAEYILPEVIAAFLTELPRVQITLRWASTGDLRDDLLKGAFDVAIGPSPSVPEGWVAEEIYRDEIVFFVSPNADLADQSNVTWLEVANRPLIGPFSQPQWKRVWQTSDRPNFQISRLVDIRGPEAIKRIVAASAQSVGGLLRSTIQAELDEGRFVAITLQDVEPKPEPYYLVYRSTPKPLVAVERFRHLLRERIATSNG